MIKIKYKNFNDVRKDKDKKKLQNISFLVHPLYYAILDLESKDLKEEDPCWNFLHYIKRAKMYDKSERVNIYKKNDNIARELIMLKSWELLKNTYKYNIPIIFQNIGMFTLFDNATINYNPVNYNIRRNYIIRDCNVASIHRSKCFLIDNEMIYSMTPESISKNIALNIMLSSTIKPVKITAIKGKRKSKKKKKNSEKETKSHMHKRRACNNGRVLAKYGEIWEFEKEETEIVKWEPKKKTKVVKLEPKKKAQIVKWEPKKKTEVVKLEPKKKTEVVKLEPKKKTEVVKLEPKKKTEVVKLEPKKKTEVVKLEPKKKTEVVKLEPKKKTEVVKLEPKKKTEVVKLEPKKKTEVVKLEPKKKTEVVKLEPKKKTEVVKLEPKKKTQVVKWKPEEEYEIKDHGDYRRKKEFKTGIKENILIYLDPFAGAGGNITHMSNIFTIAADIDPLRIKQCQHTCKLYNNLNVDYILCDFQNIVNCFRENTIDVVFLSIPWGGPVYKKKRQFSLKGNENRLCVYSCLKESLKLTNNIIFYLPRNVPMKDLYDLYSHYRKLTKLARKSRVKEIEDGRRSGEGQLVEVERRIRRRRRALGDDFFMELYVNRSKCIVKSHYDNSLMNYNYFLNEKCELYSNELPFSSVENLLRITIDETNQYLRLDEKDPEETHIEGNCDDNILASDATVEEQNIVERYISTPNSPHLENFMERNVLWRWHNTSMVIYFGNITSGLRKKKTINYHTIYYIHNMLVRSALKNVKRKNTNLSIYRLQCSNRSNAILRVAEKVEEITRYNNKQDKKDKISKDYSKNKKKNKKEIVHNIRINCDNVVSLDFFIKRKLHEITNNILKHFYRYVKNIIGFENISFFNRIFIFVGNIFEKKLTRKLSKRENMRQYQTFITAGRNKVHMGGLYIACNHLDRLELKIKEELILLFAIYIYDISYMKYYFRYYKADAYIRKVSVSKNNLKHIHYNMVRILFKFLLYIYIFRNMLTSNIKLEEYFRCLIIDCGSVRFLTPLDILIQDYRYVFCGYKNLFLTRFTKYIKKLILFCINIEFCGRKIHVEKTIPFFFRIVCKTEDIRFLIHYVENSDHVSTIQELDYYKFNLLLILINFFAKQFFYNTNVTSFLDYFNSINFFYLNQIRTLSERCQGYSNFFIFYLSIFLENNFSLRIV
ncbi:trimethylguanosine synthase, putative [Plasmodium ovale]|uniref:Trimethylguanosine synthase n=1 Tax=Plasmodium ovale TaxID=36330 RepID=A0A1D3TLW3_PLAOA|nr:trimethylguanosine synthase, putative [Plasmodium ovale]